MEAVAPLQIHRHDDWDFFAGATMVNRHRCTVTELFLHPIKGCRPIAVEGVELNEFGIAGDRDLMVAKDNKKMNLKDLPALAKITVECTDSGQLLLCANGFDAIAHKKTLDGKTGCVNFLLDQVDVVDQGDEIAEWISQVIGEPVRLVAVRNGFRRNLPVAALAKVHGTTQNSFVDVAPVLIVNEATFTDLNNRLSRPIPVQRFRPNIVVAGLEAYAEDDIISIKDEAFTFTQISACERCVVINTDHESGEINDKAPLKMLNRYRRIQDGYDSGVLFGSYYSVKGTGTLNVGDTFTVTYQEGH